MTEFVINVEEKAPKKQVTVVVDGELLFSGNVKVRNEQILDNLTQFFLRCVREDVNMQDDIERKDAGIWKEWKMISDRLKEKFEDGITEIRATIVWHENQIKCCQEQIKVMKSALED